MVAKKTTANDINKHENGKINITPTVCALVPKLSTYIHYLICLQKNYFEKLLLSVLFYSSEKLNLERESNGPWMTWLKSDISRL